MRRRSVLASLGAVFVAECVGDARSPDDTDVGARLGAAEAVPHERFHVARTNDTPEWAASVARPAGHVEMYGSTAALESIPFDRVDPSREDAVRGFVEATDFDGARLLYVVGVGPGNTELTVGVDRLGVHDGDLVGATSVRNAEEGDSIDTYASALVRAATGDRGSPPSAATVRVEAVNDRETVVSTTVE